MSKNEKRTVEMLKVVDLFPYENNARTHSDLQIDKICDSIKEFGFVNPVLITKDNMIVAGHGRIMAAKRLGIENVPCLRVENLTETQIKAYILADNKLSEFAGWDMNLVGLELGELEADDFDITVTGFDLPEFGVDDFGTDFSLMEGGKPEICQMTFTLHEEQKKVIQQAIDSIGDDFDETFGNTNKNGNALFTVVKQWAEQKK